jgi:hypothetical protein
MALLALFGLNRNKKHERYYLLPGMGGRAVRKKKRFMLLWSVTAGLLTSAVLGIALYWMSRR